MSFEWRVVPIERWPGDKTDERRKHPFRKQSSHGWMQSGVNWSSTLDTLERELEMLDAENVVLQMAVTDRDIRKDGWIRANASPSHPGVILTFDSKYGPLSYPCDTFTDWQANVRGIALALEALRKVDRYGVTRRGEQYTGWAKLPPAGGSTTTMPAGVAARILVEAEGLDGDPDDVLEHVDAYRLTYRAAAKRTHPDGGGSTRDFQAVQEARRVLEAHHGTNGSAP